ncbi:MAG: hypothetical protein DMF86_13205 [Acidobacteria bacterium]|nr:MAG: hypothetical protein DMF86_13205 [Acidobacteriota bacterium]
MTPLSRTERRLLVMWLVVAFIVWNGVWDIIFDVGVRGYLLETALAYAKMGQGVDVHVAMRRTLFDALWKSTAWALFVLVVGLWTVEALRRNSANGANGAGGAKGAGAKDAGGANGAVQRFEHS